MKESSFHKGVKYEIFIGIKDKDTHEEVLSVEDFRQILSEICHEPKHSMEHYIKRSFRDLADPKLLDLMKKLLTVDPDKRITLSEALRHPYFS